MNPIFTILIALGGILMFGLAVTFAISMIGFFLILFGIMICVLLALAIASAIAVKIFGRARVEAWLARRGINISFETEKEQRNKSRTSESYRQNEHDDGIEDAVLLDETPGPRRPNQ